MGTSEKRSRQSKRNKGILRNRRMHNQKQTILLLLKKPKSVDLMRKNGVFILQNQRFFGIIKVTEIRGIFCV